LDEGKLNSINEEIIRKERDLATATNELNALKNNLQELKADIKTKEARVDEFNRKIEEDTQVGPSLRELLQQLSITEESLETLRAECSHLHPRNSKLEEEKQHLSTKLEEEKLDLGNINNMINQCVPKTHFKNTQNKLKEIEAKYNSLKDVYTDIDTIITSCKSEKQQECGICTDDFWKENIQELPCGHKFCNECFKQQIITTLNNGVVQLPKCPGQGCKEDIPQSVIANLADEKVWEQYNYKCLESAMVKFCPSGCNYPFYWEETDNPKYSCMGCGKDWCMKCDHPFHHGITCEQYQKWKEENGQADAKFADLITQGLVKECPVPDCKAPIYKAGGCNAMRCGKCRTCFCWVCMMHGASGTRCRCGGTLH